jgi:transcriptional regulator with XRE-family HTH domain
METLDKSAIKFAEFVNYKRKQKNMRVSDVAEKAGLSKAFIYLLQSKLNQPSLSSASRILGALGETWDSFAEYMREAA